AAAARPHDRNELARSDLEIHAPHRRNAAIILGDAVKDEERRLAHRATGRTGARRPGRRSATATCATMTSAIEVKKTMLPTALTLGLTSRCSSTRMRTGKVSWKPDTNQAMAYSSKDTAIVRNSAETSAGATKGTITSRSPRHSLAPRFHAAASRFGSICARRNRTSAMAKGMQ